MMIHQVEAVMALIRHWRVFNLIFYIIYVCVRGNKGDAKLITNNIYIIYI